MLTKVVSNVGAEPLEFEQIEQGSLVPYAIEPGACMDVPLDDAELAEYNERVDAAAAAPPRPLPPPDGVVGWPCRQIVGAICTHATCIPQAVTTAAEAQATAIATADLET